MTNTTESATAAVASCTGDELVALLYVSGFMAGDAEHFGPPMLAAFAQAATGEVTAGELATICQVLAEPDPAPVVDRQRLAACRSAAANLNAATPGRISDGWVLR